jgi:hypothetical protein
MYLKVLIVRVVLECTRDLPVVYHRTKRLSGTIEWKGPCHRSVVSYVSLPEDMPRGQSSKSTVKFLLKTIREGSHNGFLSVTLKIKTFSMKTILCLFLFSLNHA